MGSLEFLSVGQKDVEAECKTCDHEDKENGNCTEGEDDVLKEYNVLTYSVEESQVEEEVPRSLFWTRMDVILTI